MFTLRRSLPAIALLLSLISRAQVQPCIDVRTARKNNGAGQGVYDFNNKWTPGTTLQVSFINGTDWQKSEVKQYAPEWSQYANVKFQFLAQGTGDIRVSFDKPGSYSFIGVDAKNRLTTEETMNLGWINTSRTEAQLKSVILHEFGHTLGLLHEHMNPMSNIKWNKPVVYAYYLQYDGWDKDMVDKQVFERYSVNMTNKSYDPKSIMHYPIPASFTLDGYSVGENDDLSDNDKKLIGELYPFNKEFPVENKTTLWSKLQDLNIEYNVTENGQLGMRIKQNFLIYNAQSRKCILAVYFYNADDGKALIDHNGIQASADGKVAAFTTFTPGYQNTQYNNLSVFMPYDELELGNGSFRLKCYVALFDPDLKVITSSGYQYFTFSQGISSKEVKVETKFSDAAQQIEITPIFTIEGAKGITCHAVAYFYDDNGVPLKDLNNLYATRDGTVSSTVDFTPGYPTTVYNNNQADFTINLPYPELHLSKGNYRLEYKVVLFDDKWNKIVSSSLFNFTFTQN
ncbi:MAG: M12 family metallopeptidase [Bacteroidota bacterium]|nr:M12 family metallopeptidase [Bacteroidota bacterium]